MNLYCCQLSNFNVANFNTRYALFVSLGVHTPVVFIILGGDRFTLKKLHSTVLQCDSISAVIINGSGLLADFLALAHKQLEGIRHRYVCF